MTYALDQLSDIPTIDWEGRLLIPKPPLSVLKSRKFLKIMKGDEFFLKAFAPEVSRANLGHEVNQ